MDDEYSLCHHCKRWRYPEELHGGVCRDTLRCEEHRAANPPRKGVARVRSEVTRHSGTIELPPGHDRQN